MFDIMLWHFKIDRSISQPFYFIFIKKLSYMLHIWHNKFKCEEKFWSTKINLKKKNNL